MRSHVADRLGFNGLNEAAAAIAGMQKLSGDMTGRLIAVADQIAFLSLTKESNAALMSLLAAYLNQGFKHHGRLHQISGDGSCVEYHYFAAGKERDAVILLATG